MDFYVFNDRERARVYYTDGKATAVIATYIGKDGGAPPPVKVLGAEIEAKPDGSMDQMKPYPPAGYWVASGPTGGGPPPPWRVRGAETEPSPDGSMCKMRPPRGAASGVAYSGSGGDQPMVMITM